MEAGESVIQRMPPELANKIAAGEVIQRPASVVKELLDNAIDAGAEFIKIIIEQAGRTLIQVVDDGCGMSKADIRLCFEQHATSKIYSIDDLFRIQTMGFRGEAMASIASVSHVEVKTKRIEDEMGTLYEIWGGEEKKFQPVATDDGTSVAVRNLFYNVPARRQFLKTDATEFRHILRMVQHAALANTNIGFELIADMDTIYKLPAQSLEERISEIFGKQYRASLIPFSEDTSFVRIHGLVADPKLAKKSRGEQFLFVNSRPVQHRYLSYVILSLFDSWTKQGEYPFYAIFLEVDPGRLDVNVHPAKQEVKFEDERSVIQLARSVVKKAINGYFVIPDLEENRDSAGQRDHSFENFESFRHSGPSLQKTDRESIPSRINFDNKQDDGLEWGRKLYESDDSERTLQHIDPKQKKSDIPVDRGFWQLHDSYILTQTRTGYCIIDQHTAHKRIIYEKALDATEKSIPGTQQLLFAQTIDFSATDFSLLKELLPIIQRMGFGIQLLSGNTAIINGVPADIDIGDERKVVLEMLQQYRDLDRKVSLDARKKVAIAFASRTAIPRGKKLTNQEMESVIDQLFACDDPYNDPLKKPTLIYIPIEEIKRKLS
ncbi:MAG: DNA mismatch repair endonuclease MutL [Balneolaceae bacterium]